MADGSDPPEPADAVGAALVICWRCDFPSPATSIACPRCRARLQFRQQSGQTRSRPRGGLNPITKVLIAYAVMLLASVILASVLHAGNKDEQTVQAGVIVVEIVDAVLTLSLAFWIGRLTIPRPPRWAAWVAWSMATPALAAVLVVNYGYHRLLEHYVQWPEWYQFVPTFDDVSVRSVLCVAVQPAIVEEYFFRYFALGALRQHCSVHAAVWISAMMFGLAHVYAPLGLPWLLLMGVVLGYSRVCGGMLLPIALHFAHNLIILWIEGGV